MTNGRHAASLIGVLFLGTVLATTGSPVRAQDAPAGASVDSTTETPPAADPATGAVPETVPAASSAAPSTDSVDSATPVESGAGPAPAAAAASSGDTPEVEPAKPTGPLVVVSWGGVYSQSQEEAIHHPFTRTTGIEISRKVYGGGLDQLRAQVEAGEVTWDVVDVDPVDAAEGCAEGLFQQMTFMMPAASDGTVASADFLPGTLQPCAVGSQAWSMLLAYSTGPDGVRADDASPTTLQDFFDTDRFPGGRGLRRTPMANLEWALLADGAAPTEIYDLLRTEAGVTRAFAKLDSIRDEIVWWNDPREPGRLLASGRVIMTSTYNAPAFADIAVRQQPFALIWDHQLWDIDLWAIPAGAPNGEAAQQFIRFATGTEPLARQTRWIPYGPVRRSAVAEVGSYVHADVEMADFLPTTEENLASALRNDALFWRERGPELVARFNAWLAR
ncbi:extracellular solute-binding protein [Pelagibius sp. 7325]|uniref:extracellular solute-binding protein n=1 Tax=Pelagibius sp. 7325 TaxID=3131994 RepID=UPI0030EE7976